MNLWRKYKDMPIQAKASIWYTICNFFQKGISFLVVPVYVRLLTTAEYGEWAVFQSWSEILIIFASLNLFAGVYTKKLVDMTNEKDRNQYTASMQGLGTTVTIALFIVYSLAHEWSNKIIGLDTPYILLLFLYFIVYPALCFWSTRQRVEYRYRSMVAITALISVLTPITSIALLYYTNLRAKSLILGFLAIQCIFGTFLYFYHFYKGKCFFHKEHWLYAARFNVPLIPHYLSLIILAQSDRIMIKYFCGESDAGIYSFAYQIALTINVLISAINGSRVPWTYEQLKARIYTKLKNVTNVLVILIGAVSIVFSLFSPEIIGILGTADYKIATYVIPIVVLGIFFTFVYDLYAAVEFYYGATRFVMYASTTGAILNIVLNLIFIPTFGFIAAAYTTLTCYIVFMLTHFLFYKKVISAEKLNEQVYDNNFIFLSLLVISIICLASMATFEHYTIRLFLTSIIVMACFFKRKTIKNLFSTISR